VRTIGRCTDWNYFTLEIPAGVVTIYYGVESICRLSLSCGELPPAPVGGREQVQMPWPRLVRDLQLFFEGKGKGIVWNYPLFMQGYTPWTRRVLEMSRKIPFGQTCTYGELAKMVGSPRAARAVGQALGRNRTPIIFPCHRVIGSRGDLVGFGEGIGWKKKLLELEKSKQR
jgi:methylated-DNA-[protein]-cysteine S-methyltransferase